MFELILMALCHSNFFFFTYMKALSTDVYSWRFRMPYMKACPQGRCEGGSARDCLIVPDSAATHKGYRLAQFAHCLTFYESGTPLREHFPFLFLEKYFLILPIHETQINDSFVNPEKFGVIISICRFLHTHL